LTDPTHNGAKEADTVERDQGLTQKENMEKCREGRPPLIPETTNKSKASEMTHRITVTTTSSEGVHSPEPISKGISEKTPNAAAESSFKVNKVTKGIETEEV
jgi:hypothetical protein